MSEPKGFPLIPVLLSISLLVNLAAWSNTRYLREEVSRLKAETSNLRSYMAQELISIRSTVQRIREDERWWTPADLEVARVEDNRAEVKLSWQVKEYDHDSVITLSYRVDGEGIFKEIAGEEETPGRFTAVVPVEIPLEPVWSVSVQRFSQQGSKAAKVVEVPRVDPGDTLGLSYYISRKTGETVLASETEYLNLDKLGLGLFTPVHVRVVYSEDGSILVDLHETGPPARHVMDRAYAEVRGTAGEVLERWDLEPLGGTGQDTDSKAYFGRGVPPASYASLYVVLHYQGGFTSEQRIP